MKLIIICALDKNGKELGRVGINSQHWQLKHFDIIEDEIIRLFNSKFKDKIEKLSFSEVEK